MLTTFRERVHERSRCLLVGTQGIGDWLWYKTHRLEVWLLKNILLHNTYRKAIHFMLPFFDLKAIEPTSLPLICISSLNLLPSSSFSPQSRFPLESICTCMRTLSSGSSVLRNGLLHGSDDAG